MDQSSEAGAMRRTTRPRIGTRPWNIGNQPGDALNAYVRSATILRLESKEALWCNQSPDKSPRERPLGHLREQIAHGFARSALGHEPPSQPATSLLPSRGTSICTTSSKYGQARSQRSSSGPARPRWSAVGAVGIQYHLAGSPNARPSRRRPDRPATEVPGRRSGRRRRCSAAPASSLPIRPW